MKEKILIVEDDKHYNEDIEFLLEFEGYSCTVADSYEGIERGLESIDEYDYVLLDIMIPDSLLQMDIENHRNLENGEIVYTKIREKNEYIPILIVSAKDEATINIDVDADPHCLFSTKPITNIESDILEKIKELNSSG